jgi:hypothetical protein
VDFTGGTCAVDPVVRRYILPPSASLEAPVSIGLRTNLASTSTVRQI